MRTDLETPAPRGGDRQNGAAQRRKGRSARRGTRSRRPAQQPDFAQAYESHVAAVYGFLGYRVDSRADAEDLTQLTFERALRAWERFDPNRGSARNWLLAIAANALVDHHRRDRTRSQEPIEDNLSQEALVTQEEDIGLSPDLAAALDELGERERELIALRFGGELTGPEIAELTELSLGNVQQILSRSLRKVRKNLEPAAVSRRPRAQPRPVPARRS
jgi:RNA polymerase sigma-70 factor (ECF subfamily)